MSIFKYADLNDINHEAPSLPPAVPREIERLNREFNVRLRVVWAPSRERREMIGFQGNPNGFIGKVYAQNPRCTYEQHVGWWLAHSVLTDTASAMKMPDTNRVVRHEGAFALPRNFSACVCGPVCKRSARKLHYDHAKDLWWIPEWKVEEVAYDRWVIEQRLSDRERDEYESCTFDANTLELVRELGIFPAEGFWVSMGPLIAEHNMLCCDEANQSNALCPGRYREPNRADVEAIREAIRRRNEEGLWEGVDSNNERQVMALRKQREAAATERLLQMRQLYREMARDAIQPALNRLSPQVIGNLPKRIHLR